MLQLIGSYPLSPIPEHEDVRKCRGCAICITTVFRGNVSKHTKTMFRKLNVYGWRRLVDGSTTKVILHSNSCRVFAVRDKATPISAIRSISALNSGIQPIRDRGTHGRGIYKSSLVLTTIDGVYP